MANSSQVTPGFDRYATMKPDQPKVLLAELLKEAEQRGYAEGFVDGKREGFKEGLQWATGK